MRNREPRDHDVTTPVTLWREQAWRIASEIGPIARLAVPLAGAQIAIVAMSATDTAFLGRVGPTALAGGGLAASIHATVQLVFAGALTVIAPLIADRRAYGDDRGVASVTRHGLAIALVLGLIGLAVVRHAGTALYMIDGPENIAGVAVPFLRAVAWSTPFSLVSAVFRHVLTAAGRPRMVTITAFAGALLNAALDYALTEGSLGVPAMGATGVGAATTIANVGMCAALAFAAARVVAPNAVMAASFDRRVVRELARLGGPAAAMIGAEVAAFQLAGVAVAPYGASWLAAHQIGLTVAWMSFVVPLGISQAASIRVAQVQAIGGRVQSRRSGLVAIGLATCFMAAISVALWLAPETLAHAFVRTDSGSPALVLGQASAVLAVAAFFQIFDGVQVVAAGALRGLRDTRIPALVGVASYGVLAPVIAWLAAAPFGLGVVGIWVGLAAGLAIVAITLVLRFLSVTSTTSRTEHGDGQG